MAADRNELGLLYAKVIVDDVNFPHQKIVILCKLPDFVVIETDFDHCDYINTSKSNLKMKKIITVKRILLNLFY